MPYQYMVIEEPSKGLWYPHWRQKDGETWKGYMHTEGGKITQVSFPSQQEAIDFNHKQDEMVRSQFSYNKSA